MDIEVQWEISVPSTCKNGIGERCDHEMPQRWNEIRLWTKKEKIGIPEIEQGTQLSEVGLITIFFDTVENCLSQLSEKLNHVTAEEISNTFACIWNGRRCRSRTEITAWKEPLSGNMKTCDLWQWNYRALWIMLGAM